MVKVVPVPRALPPVAAAYQLIVPNEAVAPKTTGPGPQELPGYVAVITGPPMYKFTPLSLPVKDGLLDTTRMRYPEPDDCPTGIVALMVPESWEAREPMMTGEAKEPTAWHSHPSPRT